MRCPRAVTSGGKNVTGSCCQPSSSREEEEAEEEVDGEGVGGREEDGGGRRKREEHSDGGELEVKFCLKTVWTATDWKFCFINLFSSLCCDTSLVLTRTFSKTRSKKQHVGSNKNT